MNIIAIDPGLTGALAVMHDGGQWLRITDLPIIRDGALAWVDGGELRRLLIEGRSGTDAIVVIERVSAMPTQGVSSSFNFGVGFGSILGAVQMLDLPLHFVQATKWKRELGLSRDKNASLDKARLLFPTAPLTLKKHDGRAEALLIAHWYVTRGRG